MIRIEALRVLIHTNTGLFARTLEFQSGLNIIRANNTSGKSSVFGAILYGLGFEEILGSRNEKALQSVFKSVVKEFSVASFTIEESIVIQSEIFLQISNGKRSITTRRFILNEKIKPQAVEVFFGSIISDPENVSVERQSMYVHDAGAASNEDIGFHKFLEEFIGAELPEIINQEGKRVKMFLPLVATPHFIEQKAGWSDFYANIPYYGIRDSAAKVFEFILNFDVFDKAAKRQENQNKIRDINDEWTSLFVKLSSLAARGGGKIIGLPENAEILDQATKPYLRFLRGDKSYVLSELIDEVSNDLNSIRGQIHVPVENNIEKIESELSNIKSNTERYELLHDRLSSQISQDNEQLRQYFAQLKNVNEDFRKNKDAEKLQNIGLEANLKVGNGICPTCNQLISDTLLDEHLHVVPMRIDENISYLQAQRKMIEAFIANLKFQIVENETKAAALENAINNNRQRIRSLKKTLVSDDRLPSEELIERKVVAERELNFLYRLREEFESLISQAFQISKKYEIAKAEATRLSGSYLSQKDQTTLDYFENQFKHLLSNFGFSSKPISTIKISEEKYLPVYGIQMNNGLNRQVDIRYESSASDYIRAQWAYYIALMTTSVAFSGNHFQTIVFDEPQQQSAATENFKVFLSELEKHASQQSIVFASFQNSEDDFKEATQNLRRANIINLAQNNELFFQRVL